ncbi:hypothetical protein BC834DRAFT_974121 [Gloeopeniophorella convolvens]|nr:hypothetical protein BC834DRAFT_974121 [Gloeopeniophorella convolvens]
MDWLEDYIPNESKQQDDLNNLAYIASALDVNHTMTIRQLPETSEQRYQEDAASLAHELENLRPENAAGSSNSGPPRSLCAAHNSGSAATLVPHDFESLVNLRLAHQTARADTGVRSHDKAQIQTTTKMEQQALLNKYDAILPGAHLKPNSEAFPPGEDDTIEDAIDAPDVGTPGTGTRAAQTRRARIYKKHKLPGFTEHANITKSTPLVQVDIVAATSREESTFLDTTQPSSYGFVFFDEGIWLAQVLSIFSRSGGKNGKHGWAIKSSSVTALSGISVQLFKPVLARNSQQFEAVVRRGSENNGYTGLYYTRLPSDHFLVALKHTPIRSIVGSSWTISTQDRAYYK